MGKYYKKYSKKVPRSINNGVRNPNSSLYSNERFERIEHLADIAVNNYNEESKKPFARAFIVMTDDLKADDGAHGIYTLASRPRHVTLSALYANFEVIGMTMEVSSAVTTLAGKLIGGPIMGGCFPPYRPLDANTGSGICNEEELANMYKSTTASAVDNKLRMYLPKNKYYSFIGLTRSAMDTKFFPVEKSARVHCIIPIAAIVTGLIVGSAAMTWYVRYTGLSPFELLKLIREVRSIVLAEEEED